MGAVLAGCVLDGTMGGLSVLKASAPEANANPTTNTIKRLILNDLPVLFSVYAPQIEVCYFRKYHVFLL
jgi:hypothetical protein